MNRVKREQVLPDLWLFADTCNVYVLRSGDRALVIDFGSGEWLPQLAGLGITAIEQVLLTHHHADQCVGLLKQDLWPFTIHAPAGEEFFLEPGQANPFGPAPWYFMGCPPSYSPPPQRIAHVRYDMMAGNAHFYWHGRRVRFIHTPGHGQNACSILIDHDGKQVVFCGDAAHAGSTVWEPFHLEWDHWTGSGALAAWEGIRRLCGIAVDLLCPSHGPVVGTEPHRTLQELSDRLLRFYHAKGQISPGECDRWLEPEILDCGARRYSSHLYQFGGNGYLLVSAGGEGLVVDPFSADMSALEDLLATLGGTRPTAMVVSHYHYDHCDGIPYLRERYGAEAWLHPWVAEPWNEPDHTFLPWLLQEPIEADHLWPERGMWEWNEYEFQIAPWPGQTWWHCAFMTSIDGKRVLFAGDSFTPSSKWNGTGGFCAYNNSRFDDGFIPSAQLVLDWRPDTMAAGHGNCYEFHPGKFSKIIEWAASARDAVRALCPSGDLEADYYKVREVVRHR